MNSEIKNIKKINKCVESISKYFLIKHGIENCFIYSAQYRLNKSCSLGSYNFINGFHIICTSYKPIEIICVCGDIHCYSGDLFEIEKFKYGKIKHLLELLLPFMNKYKLKTLSIGSFLYCLENNKFIKKKVSI